MTNLTHKVALETGDWSRDGHNQSEVVTIQSNLTQTELVAAYKKGAKKLKVDLIKNVCKEYDDHTMPRDLYNKILELAAPELVPNYKESVSETDYDDEELEDSKTVWVSSDEWPHLILLVVSIGDPNFYYEEVMPDSTWHVGGYGLFD